MWKIRKFRFLEIVIGPDKVDIEKENIQKVVN